MLKGEKLADLPVMRAVKFEFIINLQTAKTLGIAIPPGVLAIARAPNKPHRRGGSASSAAVVRTVPSMTRATIVVFGSRPEGSKAQGRFQVSHVRRICPAILSGSAPAIGSNFCSRPAKQSARYRLPS